MAVDNHKQAITQAVAYLTSLTNNIHGIGAGLLEIAENGVLIAKSEMGKLGIPTDGELGDSITAYMVDATTARLEADGGHAIYVEFGSGIVGLNSPHQEAAQRGVTYDRNGHGESGWTYNKDGEFFHTKGYKSRPFWYATGIRLKADGVKVIVARLNKRK